MSVLGVARRGWVTLGVCSAVGICTQSRLQRGSGDFGVSAREAFHPDTWRKFPLLDFKALTPDVKLMRFEMKRARDETGARVAFAVIARMVDPEDPNSQIMRPYTPVSRPQTDRGFFDIIVKRYPKGKMSTVLHGLKKGEIVEFKGPVRKLEYRPNMVNRLGMVAGGTGIAPMLQIIHEVIDNPHDKTTVDLVYCNKTPKDIIMKDHLDKLAQTHPDRFTVHYVVERPGWFWRGLKGRFSKEIAEKTLPGADLKHLVLVSGNKGMVNEVCGPKNVDFTQGKVQGVLGELGYTTPSVFKF